ncbi:MULTISPECIES: KOW domain-containing protein [Peptoniphilus]|uniref:KOW domain-containing protein n=1 Tax=Peptoniphilus TaxID=162289 RepID=UPI0001DAA156|nr:MULTISPECIES: KOW domain-containing protein [Peptoniphilus]EFI41396.1 hypothetical protein HMPREF0629_00015 [Peptoniphilus sp. oral taxon 386 str. F0131]
MDKTFFIEVGQVVKSKSGRDAGLIFLVYEILDDSYVYIVNGSNRKLNNPKKKKIKHLIKYNGKVDLQVENFNDSYIRKALKNYN